MPKSSVTSKGKIRGGESCREGGIEVDNREKCCSKQGTLIGYDGSNKAKIICEIETPKGNWFSSIFTPKQLPPQPLNYPQVIPTRPASSVLIENDLIFEGTNGKHSILNPSIWIPTGTFSTSINYSDPRPIEESTSEGTYYVRAITSIKMNDNGSVMRNVSNNNYIIDATIEYDVSKSQWIYTKYNNNGIEEQVPGQLKKSVRVEYVDGVMNEDTSINVIQVINNTITGGKKKIRKGSYESCTVAQLKEKCIKKGIKHSGLKKNELIAILRKK